MREQKKRESKRKKRLSRKQAKICKNKNNLDEELIKSYHQHLHYFDHKDFNLPIRKKKKEKEKTKSLPGEAGLNV